MAPPTRKPEPTTTGETTPRTSVAQASPPFLHSTSTATTLSTKTASSYEGIFPSPGREGDTMGVTLKDVKRQEKRYSEERETQRFDTVVPPVRLPRNADQLKIYRHLFTFLADKINSMKTLDPRLESLLPRLHTHFEKFVDYDIIVSISESRLFQETLLEALSIVGDKRYTTALDNDFEEICAHFQEVLLDTTAKYKSTIRSLRDEQAKGFMQELQEALERGSPLLQEGRLQHTAQRILIELSRACRDVPNELYVKEAIDHVSSKPIYKGTFGYIHRGECNGRLVALKRLIVLENTEDAERQAQLSAFCKEAMIWKKLCGHPHILAFQGIDIESFSGEMCMVSEWMSNGTIIKFLKREPHHAVEKYLLQIAEGIQHLHSLGMCHGDLKGENILVSSNREAKIADFGLANFANMSATYTTARMGTPRWMAPELIDNTQKFQRTTKSDIFAFACIAFEIYTGVPNFLDNDGISACRRILAGERPERPTHGRHMMDSVWDLIKRCWWQNPSFRPQIDEVVRELQEVDGTVPTKTAFRYEGIPDNHALDSKGISPSGREGDTMGATPPVRLLRNFDQLKIYRHLSSFIANKINSMKSSDIRLKSLLPRLHTHFETFVDYDIIVSISESRQFRETLLEASLMVGDRGYTIALDEDGEELCALFQKVLMDRKYKSTIRTLRKEQARVFMQELQEALNRGSPWLQEDQLQRTAQRILIDLSKACGDVPDELYVKEKIEGVSSSPIFVGGFGHIHRGVCNGRLVALKRLFDFENPTRVQAFCKEAMAWKNLSGHPHILAFLGVDIESFPGEMCMVSEWMSNGTINKFLKREPHRPVEKYLLQIAEGIQYLHSRGMYHGGLKGENILVSSNQEVKIADFGFANFAEMSVSYATARMGTPRWMPPEELDSKRKFQRTTKSDIYAFACTAFEIYTGAPIFPDDDNVRACRRILAGERPERPTYGRHMPNRVWHLIEECWSKDPSSRPQIDKVVKELSSPASGHALMPTPRGRGGNMPMPSPSIGAGGGGGMAPVLKFDAYGEFSGLLYNSPHSVVYEEDLYPTAFHLFEARKFLDHRPDLADRIRRCERVEDVIAIGVEQADFTRRDWGNVALSMMDEALYLKFRRHRKLRALLLNTYPADLIYVESGDSFWGDGTGNGMNQLGISLMRVRERIRMERGM